MKHLIIVENIGKETTKKTDKKIVNLIKKGKDIEFSVYCNNFDLNPAGEFIRARGVKILPVQQAQPGTIFEDEFDKIIEVDEWAKEKSPLFSIKEAKKTNKKEVSKPKAKKTNKK